MTVRSPSAPAIALVAGYDVRGKTTGANPYAGSNSDTLMLLRADPTTNTLSLLSFPRDLYVNIYCHGDTVYTQNRINSAWGTCGNNGPAATLDTIQHLTGLKINYLITLDFHAFKQLVNNLHGVYMNVDRRYYIPSARRRSAINLQPGYQKLDGGQALSYVRYRHTDSDIYRTGRQQLFIEALKSRLTYGPLADESSARGSEAGRRPQAQHRDRQGRRGQVDFGELTRYLGLLYHLPPGHLFRNAIPLNDFHVLHDGGRRRCRVRPAERDRRRGAQLPQPGRPRRPGGQQPVRRHAEDAEEEDEGAQAAEVAGLGARPQRRHGRRRGREHDVSAVEARLHDEGASGGRRAERAEAAERHDHLLRPGAGRTRSRPRSSSGRSSARTRSVVQMTLPIAGLREAGRQSDDGRRGRDELHRQARRPPRRRRSSRRRRPQVSNGAAMTAPRLRQVYDRVHFPLMVPDKIAEGSVLSDSEGVRGFKPLKNQHEVALTFVMPEQIEYWQIEETTGSPRRSSRTRPSPSSTAARSTTSTRPAAQVQMVALVTPHATYWVSNTILNELSNKTMLAIAESLQPLRR